MRTSTSTVRATSQARSQRGLLRARRACLAAGVRADVCHANRAKGPVPWQLHEPPPPPPRRTDGLYGSGGTWTSKYPLSFDDPSSFGTAPARMPVRTRNDRAAWGGAGGASNEYAFIIAATWSSLMVPRLRPASPWGDDQRSTCDGRGARPILHLPYGERRSTCFTLATEVAGSSQKRGTRQGRSRGPRSPPREDDRTSSSRRLEDVSRGPLPDRVCDPFMGS